MTTLCTTCGKPAFPHPYRHPITLAAETTATLALIDPPFVVQPQRDDSMPNPSAMAAPPHTVSQDNYRHPITTTGKLGAALSELSPDAQAFINAFGDSSDLSWLDELLKGIDSDDPDDGWWETSTGATFGAAKLAALKTEITRRYPVRTAYRDGARDA